MRTLVDPFQTVDSMRRLFTHVRRYRRMPLLCIHQQPPAAEVIRYHQKHFLWHAQDTRRSFLSTTYSSAFSYRKRMTETFDVDQLEHMIWNGWLVSVWDPATDNRQPRGQKPCLLSLLCFQQNHEWHLACTFRARDVVRRMIPNVCMLFHLLDEVVEQRGGKRGAVHDYSYQAFIQGHDDQKLGGT